MADKDSTPRKSDQVVREMFRCSACRAWQSTDGSSTTCGGCGGRLELVDWDAHYKTLPRVPHDPAKDPNNNKK